MGTSQAMSEHGTLLTMGAETYHTSPGVSASMLDLIRKSPAHLKWAMDGGMEKETDSLTLGSLCHRAVFEPDTLTDDLVHILPEFVWMERARMETLSSAVPFLDKEGNLQTDESGRVAVTWSGTFKEVKDWMKEHGDGREIITSAEWRRAVRIRDNVLHQPVIRGLLSGGHAEQSLFVEDEQGTLRKSRFDYISTSGNFIPDLKTTRDASADEFEKAIAKFHYWERAAFYLDNATLGGIPKDAFIFICVETSPPYNVAVYQLDEIIVEAGRMFYKRNLQLYRNCMESGKWPGYHEGIRAIGLPPYMQKQLEAIA